VTDVVQTGVATSTTRVDYIPVTWVSAADRRAQAPLALWMPALGTNEEWVVPFLGELASAGFLAVSFDPWEHGERATESPEQIRDRVYGNFRRQMWPILGQTTLDALQVIDWAIDALGAGTPCTLAWLTSARRTTELQSNLGALTVGVPRDLLQELAVLQEEPSQYWRSRAELPWN
jgi:hypothetical protein